MTTLRTAMRSTRVRFLIAMGVVTLLAACPSGSSGI